MRSTLSKSEGDTRETLRQLSGIYDVSFRIV